jgi:hypothetical protein
MSLISLPHNINSLIFYIFVSLLSHKPKVLIS